MRGLTIVLLCFWITISNAQVMTSKDIDSFNSYGQKKFHKAPKRIYIASFKVFYQVYISDEHKHNKHDKAPGHEFEATLTEIDVVDFQSITDELYLYFIDTLVKSGYEVIQFRSVKNLNYFKGWEEHKGGEVSHSHIEGYLLSRPSGYTHYEHKDNQKISFVDDWPRLSNELDSAIIMDVEFVLPFVQTKHSKTGYEGHHISDAHLQLNLAPEVGGHDASATARTEIKIMYGNLYGVSAISTIASWLKHQHNIEGVLKTDKLEPKKETVQPKYYNLVFDQEGIDKVTHHVDCDKEMYKKASVGEMKAFSRFVLQEFLKYSGGK